MGWNSRVRESTWAHQERAGVVPHGHVHGLAGDLHEARERERVRRRAASSSPDSDEDREAQWSAGPEGVLCRGSGSLARKPSCSSLSRRR